VIQSERINYQQRKLEQQLEYPLYVSGKKECRYVAVAGTVLVAQGDRLPHTERSKFSNQPMLFQSRNDQY